MQEDEKVEEKSELWLPQEGSRQSFENQGEVRDSLAGAGTAGDHWHRYVHWIGDSWVAVAQEGGRKIKVPQLMIQFLQTANILVSTSILLADCVFIWTKPQLLEETQLQLFAKTHFCPSLLKLVTVSINLHLLHLHSCSKLSPIIDKKQLLLSPVQRKPAVLARHWQLIYDQQTLQVSSYANLLLLP